MKILDFNDSTFAQTYIPFVHCFKDDGTCYLEVLVKVKTGETIQVLQQQENPDEPLYVHLIVIPSDSVVVDTAFQLIYIEPLPLNPKPEIIGIELSVIIQVETPELNPQDGGTAIVRYRDIS